MGHLNFVGERPRENVSATDFLRAELVGQTVVLYEVGDSPINALLDVQLSLYETIF